MHKVWTEIKVILYVKLCWVFLFCVCVWGVGGVIRYHRPLFDSLRRNHPGYHHMCGAAVCKCFIFYGDRRQKGERCGCLSSDWLKHREKTGTRGQRSHTQPITCWRQWVTCCPPHTSDTHTMSSLCRRANTCQRLYFKQTKCVSAALLLL